MRLAMIITARVEEGGWSQVGGSWKVLAVLNHPADTLAELAKQRWYRAVTGRARVISQGEK